MQFLQRKEYPVSRAVTLRKMLGMVEHSFNSNTCGFQASWSWRGMRGVRGGGGGTGRGSGGGEAGEWGLEGNLSLSPRLKSSRFEPIPHTVVMPLISHLSSAVKLPEQLWSSCGYMTCALGTHLCLKHESAASPTVEFSSQTNTQNNPPCS